jgi:hypothetical protein
MGNRDWLFEVPQKEREAEASVPSLNQILQLRLAELSRRNIALKIFSEILDCEIWLCGNEKMASQVQQDDPGVVTYTVSEMRKL